MNYLIIVKQKFSNYLFVTIIILYSSLFKEKGWLIDPENRSGTFNFCEYKFLAIYHLYLVYVINVPIY